MCSSDLLSAELLGREAANKAVVAPMIVQEHTNMMDDTSPVAKSYYVPDGVCGFAWLVVRPGNSSFAHWLKKTKGGRKEYYGGVAVSIHDYNQSMQRKEAHASAMAKYLREVLAINIYSQSRMD